MDSMRDSRQIMHYGAGIAAAADAEVSVLHVAKPGIDGEQREWPGGRGTVRSGRASRAHRLVLPGKRAETIVKYADDIDADVILMPACKRGLFGQLLFGSTSMDVVRGTNRPVWIAKPPLEAKFHGGRILCWVKLGAEGQSLIRYAARWASVLQGKLLLVHAVPLISEAMLASYGFEDWGEIELMPKAAHRRVMCMAEGIDVPYEVEVVTGDVRGNVRKAADRWRADLVIAGRSRRGVGGKAGEIIARSPCPVISYCEEYREAEREAARCRVLRFPRRG